MNRIESRDVMVNVTLSFILKVSWLDSCSAGRSTACASFACRGWSLTLCLLRLKAENVARLARERLADRIERREADRARLAGLEDREVGQRDSDPVGEIRQCHPAIVEQVVELDGDRHLTPSLRGPRA